MIKLGDFGLAAELAAACTQRNTVCGTAWYMAPEMFDGQTERKSDVWSLGISLMELADGKNPYAEYNQIVGVVKENDAQTVKILRCGEPPSLSSSGWSSEFVDFVGKCLVKDVNERWDVRALLGASDCE